MVENLYNEIWMPIPVYESLYEVSNLGRIKSLGKVIQSGLSTRTTTDYIKIQPKKETGYLRVTLSKNGFAKTYAVHRIVLITFKGEHETLKEVNHINGVKCDNRLENLEWSNRSLNTKHSFHVLGRSSDSSPFKRGENHIFYTKGYEVHNKRKVKCDTLGMEFNSLREAGEILGLRRSSVCDVLRGRLKHEKGLTFRYL